MFFKKKKSTSDQDDKVVLGMIMLNDSNRFNVDAFLNDYHANYHTGIEQPDGNSDALAFAIDGETCAIGFMPMPIPGNDIESTAKYAYNWVHALEQTKDHQAISLFI